MSFHFKKAESLKQAFRRISGGHLADALSCLRKPGHASAVHGVRKEIKKLRALFRLVRREISADTYHAAVKSLRTAAGCLAATRDARVMLRAFNHLTGDPARRFAGVESALQKHVRREAHRFRADRSMTQARRQLRKAGRRASRVEFKARGWMAIEPGLRVSYRRSRAACQLAARKPLPGNFHKWRRHVKDLGYYFGLLYPASTARMRSRERQLKLLAEQLGEDHDLFLLQEFMSEHARMPSHEVEALNRLIVARQRKLRVAALKLGRRLHAETPAAVCRRLETDWNRWRKK
jgi:CHAD domain-containing protein